MGQVATQPPVPPLDLATIPEAIPRLATAEIAIVGGEDPVQALFRDPQLASATLAQLQPAPRTLRAAAEMGIDAVRNAALLAAADQRVLSVPGFARNFSRLRRHAIATAHLTEVVCTHAEVPTQHAFLAGLFHDIAPAAVAVGLNLRDRDALHVRWRYLMEASADLAWLLGEVWLLPNSVREAIDTFHREAPDFDQLGAALTVADALALDLVLERRGRSLPLLGPSPALVLAQEVLGLVDEDEDALRDAARVHLESVPEVEIQPLTPPPST